MADTRRESLELDKVNGYIKEFLKATDLSKSRPYDPQTEVDFDYFDGEFVSVIATSGSNLIEQYITAHIEDMEVINSALRWAVYTKYHLFISLLISKGADVNAIDYGGNTMLLDVISNLSIDACEIVPILLGINADVNVVDANGFTPLMHAVSRSTDIVNLLLQAGANANAMEVVFRSTALHIAVHHGQQDTIKLLLQAGANTSIREWLGMTALHIAAHLGQQDTIKLLLHAGADTFIRDSENKTPLDSARMNHDVRQLILNARSIKRIAQKLPEILRGESTSRFSLLPLDLIKYVINNFIAGFNVNEHFVTNKIITSDEFLHACSVRNYNPIVVDNYIEQNIDRNTLYEAINVKADNGQTALHISFGFLSLMLRLIESGIDVNAVDNMGFNALIYNVRNPHCDEAAPRILIEAGLDVNAQDAEGCTALHYEAANGDAATVSLLLQHGANPMIKNKKGYTPLNMATARNGTIRTLCAAIKLVTMPEILRTELNINGVSTSRFSLFKSEPILTQVMIPNYIAGYDTSVNRSM